MQIKKIPFLIITILISINSFGQSKAKWQGLMDSFCKRHFETCFSGKKFISINIDNIEKHNFNSVRIEGTITHTKTNGQCKRAFIAEIKTISDYYIIEINKEAKTWSGESHREKCVKKFYY